MIFSTYLTKYSTFKIQKHNLILEFFMYNVVYYNIVYKLIHHLKDFTRHGTTMDPNLQSGSSLCFCTSWSITGWKSTNQKT